MHRNSHSPSARINNISDINNNKYSSTTPPHRKNSSKKQLQDKLKNSSLEKAGPQKNFQNNTYDNSSLIENNNLSIQADNFAVNPNFLTNLMNLNMNLNSLQVKKKKNHFS